MDVALVAQLAVRDRSVLLLRPRELAARLDAVSQVLSSHQSSGKQQASRRLTRRTSCTGLGHHLGPVPRLWFPPQALSLAIDDSLELAIQEPKLLRR